MWHHVTRSLSPCLRKSLDISGSITEVQTTNPRRTTCGILPLPPLRWRTVSICSVEEGWRCLGHSIILMLRDSILNTSWTPLPQIFHHETHRTLTGVKEANWQRQTWGPSVLWNDWAVHCWFISSNHRTVDLLKRQKQGMFYGILWLFNTCFCLKIFLSVLHATSTRQAPSSSASWSCWNLLKPYVSKLSKRRTGPDGWPGFFSTSIGNTQVHSIAQLYRTEIGRNQEKP